MKKIISIALSDEKAYVILLERERDGWAYRAADKISLAATLRDPEPWVALEKKFLEKHGALWDTKNVPVLFVIPDEQCYTHAVLRDDSASQINDAEKVMSDIARVVPVARNEIDVRWEYSKTKKRIVAAAAKKQDVAAIRNLTARFLQEPTALYPEPLALCSSLVHNATEGAVIIDVGEYRTNAIFFDEDGFLGNDTLQRQDENLHAMIAKHFRTSFSQAQTMRKSIGMDKTQEGGKLFEFLQNTFDEALRECARLLESARSKYQKPFPTIYFIGELIDTPHLIEHFHHHVGGAIARADPWQSILSAPQHLRRDTGFAAAIGMAMRSNSFSDIPPINFSSIAPSRASQPASAVASFFYTFFARMRIKATLVQSKRAAVGIAIAALVITGVFLWRTIQPIWFSTVLPKEIDIAIFLGEGAMSDAISGKSWETTIAVSDTFPASGFKETPSVASGTIRLVNNTNSPVQLRATTRLVLENESSATYRMPKQASIPARATKDVVVAAEEAGPERNAPAGTRMFIPGLSPDLQQYVYGEVFEPIENGLTRTQVVSEEDIQNAVSRLKQQVALQAFKLFEEQVATLQHILLKEPIETMTVEENIFTKPGDVGKTFSVSLRARVIMVSFPQQAAWQYIAKALSLNEEDFMSHMKPEQHIDATFLNYNQETKVVYAKVLLPINNTE
ncbi:MAG: hypothetical protein A3C81_00135 [Candidatus Yanofskybacteria bacterium RIFCSPHIGHO2_02_FULL_46_19]|uniref:SHS2 domain-containing protein n=1 Tax=Candidatus Yanofskybacteria bacterium RIFCSPHIGHO2_02_FULL_46_19 TaxID=1802684 RepID=A0A1F8FSA6_9BACT|nr:MAG: hypothetical protein A3C81_00135 [Candidatus Yanofskybacteria bacterium RIFCSPHIGHO2_02_FULL_46_19]